MLTSVVGLDNSSPPFCVVDELEIVEALADLVELWMVELMEDELSIEKGIVVVELLVIEGKRELEVNEGPRLVDGAVGVTASTRDALDRSWNEIKLVGLKDDWVDMVLAERVDGRVDDRREEWVEEGVLGDGLAILVRVEKLLKAVW